MTASKAEVVAQSEQLVVSQDVTSFLRFRTSLYLATKRIFDIFASIIGLILAAPIMLGVALAIKCQDGGKVFYKQTRIGKNGENFEIIKFRSMVKDAEKVLEELIKANPIIAKEYKQNHKLKDDPRITKIGKFIRKTSIDELPQLFNILKGEMSIIGNRPYLLREQKAMGQKYESIITTKPGLTGYWQISGRSGSSFEERLIFEEYYSYNCSLKLDVKIFFKTFIVVLGCKGAE